jgi:predicted GIY-YIG superfamily endonuclease
MESERSDRSKRSDRWFCYTVATRKGLEDVYSGATNNLTRRMRQHNNEIRGGSLFCKRWGIGNARLVLLIGPIPRNVALSIERYLKKSISAGGGIHGRCRAVAKLLAANEYITKSARLTGDELGLLRVRTTLSKAQFLNQSGLDPNLLGSRFQFDAQLSAF